MNKNEDKNTYFLKMSLMTLAVVPIYGFYSSLGPLEKTLLYISLTSTGLIGGLYVWDRKSKVGRDRQKRIEAIKSIPVEIIDRSGSGVLMGVEVNLQLPIYLPNAIRSRHVHIMGATGSGKTESVILNFIQQDVERGFGSIILDAKGDSSFLKELRGIVPEERLKVFDLGSARSAGYDPLEDGSPLESAQRLFSALTWSEEYYKSKALTALQNLFQAQYERTGKNPKLEVLLDNLSTEGKFIGTLTSLGYSKDVASDDFADLSGLRDQIRALCLGHLQNTLSPKEGEKINLKEAENGLVIYFRLQSLLSPQLVSVVGKLVVSHLNFLAGTSHQSEMKPDRARPFVPVYFDEFASFACPEFSDLISKARSAGYAIHFSHQSLGDLKKVSDEFLSQVTDNSATKIILRVNDPDSAEYFARTFGTRFTKKATYRVTNAEDVDQAEVSGEASMREVQQFRSSPDLFKTLPTGMGSVLIAHGSDTSSGASHVFKIKFPKLKERVK